MYRGLPSADPANLPVAIEVSRKVLCLPIFPGLEPSEVERISSLIVTS